MPSWTAEAIRQKLLTDQRWLERAIIVIYDRQTERERDKLITEDYNEMGFNNVDCRAGAIMARWLKAGNRLTGKWIVIARKIMPKYANQLAAIAQSKENAEPEVKEDRKVEESVFRRPALNIPDCEF